MDSAKWAVTWKLERYISATDVARVTCTTKRATPVAAGRFTVVSDRHWNGLQLLYETSISQSAIRIVQELFPERRVTDYPVYNLLCNSEILWIYGAHCRLLRAATISEETVSN